MVELLAASLALSAIGGVYSGFSKAKGMEQEASDMELSANELLFRAKDNAQELELQSQSLYGEQVVSAAASGADVSSGSPLQAYAQNFERTAKAKMNMIREAEYQANTLRTSGSRLRKQATKTRYASLIGGAADTTMGLYKYSEATDASKSTSEVKTEEKGLSPGIKNEKKPYQGRLTK